MGPSELDTLKELVRRFSKDLSRIGAPGAMKARASDVLVAIEWMKKKRGYE